MRIQAYSRVIHESTLTDVSVRRQVLCSIELAKRALVPDFSSLRTIAYHILAQLQSERADALLGSWGMAMKMKYKTCLGALLAVAAVAFAQLASAADVTGTWIMAVQTSAGSGSPTFILLQKGAEI